jgi:TRAP-type mannitol/chloroaromatic compound transport system permease large subunit
VVPQVPASEIFWGAAPFVLLISFSVLLLVVWPGMALWLPSLMR